jgi:hypothetical protein
MENTAKVGTYTTMISFILGNIFHLEKSMQQDVMFWLQTGAFLISIIVGVLTACYYIQRLRANSKKKKYEEH